jgi:hypothetical protein
MLFQVRMHPSATTNLQNVVLTGLHASLQVKTAAESRKSSIGCVMSGPWDEARAHPFHRCPDFGSTRPKESEHVRFKNNIDLPSDLEDLLAYEHDSSKHANKLVRVEDATDEDEVRFVNVTVEKKEKRKPKRAPQKPRQPKPVPTEPNAANKAASQLIEEAKISLTSAQICDIASRFCTEVRHLLLKPRNPKSTKCTAPAENVFVTPSGDDDNGCCPQTVVNVYNKLAVNAVLDGGAVLNIINLALVKQVGIKKLTKSYSKYITANSEKSQALRIVYNINIKIRYKIIKNLRCCVSP